MLVNADTGEGLIVMTLVVVLVLALEVLVVVRIIVFDPGVV